MLCSMWKQNCYSTPDCQDDSFFFVSSVKEWKYLHGKVTDRKTLEKNTFFIIIIISELLKYLN